MKSLTNLGLTMNQEKFLLELAKGKTQREAYNHAYPKSLKWNPSHVDIQASQMLKKPKVRERFDMMMQVIREEELLKARWSREESISNLRYIIEVNKREMGRIQESADEEIESLLKMAEAHPEDAIKFIRKIREKRQSRYISGVHNTGVIQAVSELNKMSGFNEENINLNAMVSFDGDDKLEE